MIARNHAMDKQGSPAKNKISTFSAVANHALQKPNLRLLMIFVDIMFFAQGLEIVEAVFATRKLRNDVIYL